MVLDRNAVVDVLHPEGLLVCRNLLSADCAIRELPRAELRGHNCSLILSSPLFRGAAVTRIRLAVVDAPMRPSSPIRVPAGVRAFHCALLGAALSTLGCAHSQPGDQPTVAMVAPVTPVIERPVLPRTLEQPARPAEGTPSPTRLLAESIRRSADNQGFPYLIVDKVDATVTAFDAQSRMIAISPVLLGSARGDHSVPGIGERPIAKIRPHERTTPAGRFVAETGRNMQGEAIVWVDYEHAVSMHRVRATNPAERRLQRLATVTPRDNRISYGCINVPVKYFDQVVWPLMRKGAGRAIVYVLPEVQSVEQVFSFVGEQPARAEDGRNDNRARRPG